MTTAHELGLSRSMDKRMIECEFLGGCVAKTRINIADGRYPDDLVNFVFQRGDRRHTSTEDAYAFAQVWAMYNNGKFSFAYVDVGREPGPDGSVAQNQTILRENLPSVFVSTVDCKLLDQDGSISWSVPICLTSHKEGNGELCDCGCNKRFVDIASSFCQDTVPLEIGSTTSSRTLLHLAQSGGLARWPYGSNRILIGVVSDG